MKLANIGCGKVIRKEWINLDLFPSSSEVIKCDITKGLPFQDNTIDACYSSHVLEHLTPDDGKNFLAEQFRVLKSGGIIRVVVPDLENICSNYLAQLHIDEQGADQAVSCRHYYSVLEVVDQLTRHETGGQIMRFWKTLGADDRNYVAERNGIEALEGMMSRPDSGQPNKLSPRFSIRKKVGDLLSDAGFALLSKLKKRNVQDCYNLGVFRLSGEVHRFMYDSLLLRDFLRAAGFSDIRKVESCLSAIPSFPAYQLDEMNGVKRKPESLYMEARKICLVP